MLNKQLNLLPYDLLEIFKEHDIARKKLCNELFIYGW